MDDPLDRFLKELTAAQNVADGFAPMKVRAKVYRQMGRDVLVARCPRCGVIAGLDGEGKHLCRGCHQWLHYVREE